MCNNKYMIISYPTPTLNYKSVYIYYKTIKLI